MTNWDRVGWTLVMVAVVLGASAINEVRQGEILSGLVILAVALGVAGLWHLVRRYADRP